MATKGRFTRKYTQSTQFKSKNKLHNFKIDMNFGLGDNSETLARIKILLAQKRKKRKKEKTS